MSDHRTVGTQSSEETPLNIRERTTTLVVVALIQLLAGACSTPTDLPEQIRLADLPPTAEIIFGSTRDTDGRRKELYSMDRNGGHVTRLTFTEEHHRNVGISPSRKTLVVTRIDDDTESPSGLGDEDRTNLWLFDLETKNETRLTERDNTAEGDSFSPDGEWIVFFMVVAGEVQSDIYKIRKDGTDLTRLTSTADATEGDPTWSHDGDQIYFVSYSAAVQRFVLKVMDADGSNVRTIYDAHSTVSTPYFPPGIYDPSCSPDGQWIVFEEPISSNGENGTAGTWHVFKIRPDGTGLVDLSEAGGHAGRAEYLPSFSRDGQSIVLSARYGTADPANVEINVFTMDTGGGALQRLTQAPAYDDFAVWIW